MCSVCVCVCECVKLMFLFNKKHRRHNFFQHKDNRKATHSFAPRPQIFKLQQVLRFYYIYVSWSSPKNDLETNFSDLKNLTFEYAIFLNSNFWRKHAIRSISFIYIWPSSTILRIFQAGIYGTENWQSYNVQTNFHSNAYFLGQWFKEQTTHKVIRFKPTSRVIVFSTV